jgi:hypothetical protein
MLARGLPVQPEACRLQVVRTRSGYALKALRTSLPHPQDHVPEILEQVETVRYLDSTRCRFPDGVGVLAAAVTAYYLHTGMLSEPS